MSLEMNSVYGTIITQVIKEITKMQTELQNRGVNTNNKKHRILDIQTPEEEYDLLVSMLSCFKSWGGDAVKCSFSAWKGMHDECTDFSYKQNKANA